VATKLNGGRKAPPVANDDADYGCLLLDGAISMLATVRALPSTEPSRNVMARMGCHFVLVRDCVHLLIGVVYENQRRAFLYAFCRAFLRALMRALAPHLLSVM